MRPCEGERKRLEQRANELVRALMPDAGLELGRLSTRLRLDELQEKELVVGEAAAAPFHVVQCVWAMHPRKRLAERRQVVSSQVIGGHVLVVVRPVEQLVEVLLEDASQHPLRHVLARRIRDEDHPRALGELFAPRENREFARMKLTPVKELHVPGHEQGVTLAELPLEPRLARPGDGDHSRVVFDHRLENLESTPRGDDALAANAPDRGDIHTHLETPDWLHGRRIVVATRNVVQEIASGGDAELEKRVCALRAYALEELDRSVELRVAQGPKTASTNDSTSKPSRSPSPSPVPTSFTGSPYSSCSATMIPPRAEESIFARKMPVS